MIVGQSMDRLEAVAGSVSRETFDDLLAFEPFFRKWANSINLVAASTLPDLWERHILDSAQLIRFAPQASSWLDLGSGGGFPGLIIAFLLKERANASVDLIESNHKKSAFLRTAVGHFGLPARVHTARFEALHEKLRVPDVVTARAVGSLTWLFEAAQPWLSGGATGLFHKGRDYRIEVQESLLDWDFDLIEHRSSVDPESVVLEVKGVHRKQ